jgi:carboxylate-amine ligase
VQQARREQESKTSEPTAIREAPSAAIAAGWLAASLGDAFSAAPALTVGLEEELILVDAESLLPVDAIEPVLALVKGDDRFTAELRASQVELRTPICMTVADACRELSNARRLLLALLTGEVRLLAVGTHPVAAGPIVVTQRDRYQRIAYAWGWVTRRGHPSGLHVHVGVGDPGEALAVYNAARSYLPEIAALAANSPFFEGTDSGLASTRLKLTEDWPRAGVPPVFPSWRKLAEFAIWARSGETPADLSYLWWDLRPRPDYGTLEFRVADTQLTPNDAGAIAAFCQTLVAALADRRRRGQPLPIHETHLLSENRWRALRDGVEGTLIDPDSGRCEPTRDRIARLLVELEPHAGELGCTSELGHAQAMLDANGAIRQRTAAAESGIGGLLAWLADTTERDAEKPPQRSGDPDALPPAPAESVAESPAILEALAPPASAFAAGEL